MVRGIKRFIAIKHCKELSCMKDFEAIIPIGGGESYNFRTFGSKPVIVSIFACLSSSIYVFCINLLIVAVSIIIWQLHTIRNIFKEIALLRFCPISQLIAGVPINSLLFSFTFLGPNIQYIPAASLGILGPKISQGIHLEILQELVCSLERLVSIDKL